ncbi:MAG: hypothetical protein AB8F34_13305 [Akkermansiaceae bacterium]
MKILSLSLISSLFCISLLSAQQPATKPADAATAKPSFEFYGKTYVLGYVARNKASAYNTYYTKGSSPKSWIQRVGIAITPGQSDINKSMQAMMGFYKKGKQETEVGKLSTPRIVSFYAYEKHPEYHQFNIHCLHNGANGKGVVIRTYSIKNLPKNEKNFRATTARLKEAYLSKLAMLKLPKFTLKDAAKPAPAEPSKLPALETITEKVTDIRDTGKLHTIDDAFAKKNGAEPGRQRAFTIAVPKEYEGRVIMQTRPKVKEAIRFTQAIQNKLHESARLTGLTIPVGKPMEHRLQTAAALIEKQSVPAFFKGKKDGKIGMRYRTKVGPYAAACLLGRFTAEDGTIFYIKFVAILEEKNPQGLLAVMLLNPTGDQPLNIKKRMQDGFAQQVLHSIRFVE